MSLFAVIDGGEGSGTTTLAHRLHARFPESIRTREPGGSRLGEELRGLILRPDAAAYDAETMFAAFWAARRDHMREIIIPARKQGRMVFSDRFDSSTWAYQIRGQEQSQLVELFWAVRAHYLKDCAPDMYIILDVPPEIGVPRAKSRGDEMTHFDLAEMDFHRRVRSGYLEFVKDVRTTQRQAVIDATKTKDEVFAEAIAFIEAH